MFILFVIAGVIALLKENEPEVKVCVMCHSSAVDEFAILQACSDTVIKYISKSISRHITR